MRILFLIARQFNQLLQVKELMAKGMDKGTIASKLKMQPFVVGKTMPQARQFSREQILSYVNSCVETEEAVKSGRLQDRLAVELDYERIWLIFSPFPIPLYSCGNIRNTKMLSNKGARICLPLPRVRVKNKDSIERRKL